MKVAIVCDWLTTFGGMERVIKTISDIYPDAPIFTSQYREKEVDWFADRDVRTGWLNIFPARFRKIMPVLRALYFSRLDLSEYDLIISIACGECKGVRTNKSQTHICYLQGPPTQYLWGMQDYYMENPGFGKLNFLVRFFYKLLTSSLRKTDYKYAQRPDFILAISSYCAKEIKKYYGRDSKIVFPPVDTARFKRSNDKEDFFFTTSRQANWKRLDLAIEACKKTGDKLMLVGDGAEHKKLVQLAKGYDNIEFRPMTSSSDELAAMIKGAKGYIFPSVEPFGIAPIESLAMGIPVIALHDGGALDYIQDRKNGVFFEKQNAESIVQAIKKFNVIEFDSTKIAESAEKFSTANFKKSFKKAIATCVKK